MSSPSIDSRCLCRVAIVALLWMCCPGASLAQSFGLGLETPATVAAGNSFAARTTVSVSGASASAVVVWLELATSLAQDFGQNEDLQLQSATSGGVFTATAIVVDGVEVPASSVYWRVGTINAGVALALTANLRAPAGSLAGTVHGLQARVQSGPGAPGASSSANAVTVTAQPRPTVAVQPGSGWLLLSGNAVAAGGSTVGFNVVSGNQALAGTETLYQTRSWLALDPLCTAIGEAAADCVARISGVSSGGTVEPAFDPDGDGGTPPGPAVVWSPGALAPGASLVGSFLFALPEGMPDPTPFTLTAALDSVRSARVTAARAFEVGFANYSAPSGAFALGNRIRGSASITAGANNNSQLAVSGGEIFQLLSLVGNNGLSRLGDVVQFVRVPGSLHFVDALMPGNAGGRVFYSLDESFPDPSLPPPADLSAAIGSASLPDDIDVDGNDFWQALDIDPPADPDAVRWVALYVANLASPFFPEPGMPTQVIGEISLRPAQVACTSAIATLRANYRVFSTTPPGGSEIAIAPPLAAVDVESVNLASNTPVPSLVAAGASSAAAGSGTPAQVTFTLGNSGQIPLVDAELTLTWPTLSINGVPSRPSFLSASGGTVDASDADIGVVRVSLAPVAPGSSRAVSLSLLYPAGVVGGSTHAISANAFVEGQPCSDGVANATRVLVMQGSPTLQLSASSDQPGVEPGAPLSFTARQRNSGSAVATGGFVFGPVPARTVMRRAELPPGRRLLCSAPPLDQSLPQDLDDPDFVFTPGVFATQFAPGLQTAEGWTCPGGDTTSWIALALDDEALAPPSFVTGSDEIWRLHLVNDEIRDEPDAQQQGSAVGTEIAFQLAILANGLPRALGNRVSTRIIDEATPLASLALGDSIGGSLQITAGNDDNPSATVAIGGSFELGIRLDNLGAPALGDVIHFLRLPETLLFRGATLPPGIEGRVFYSTDAGFNDPQTPPPVDLSALIGNTDLPENIDVEGNSLWQALDLAPPPDPAALRWLAIYLASVPGEASPAVSRVTLESLMADCTEVVATLRAPTRIHSATPPGGSEVPATPTTLELSDAEPVRLANLAASMLLSSPTQGELVAAGSGLAQAFAFTLQNTGSQTLETSSVLLTWPQLSINGIASYPEFVAATGGVVDASEAGSGRVVIAPGPIAPGASASLSVFLRYPAGVVNDDFHSVEALASAGSSACGEVFAFGFAFVFLSGEPVLQVSASADQATLAPGAELSFTGGHGNSGTAVDPSAIVFGAVPLHSTFVRAELAPGRTLFCSSTPPDQDPLAAGGFVMGVETEDGWLCPQGGATNWIALALADPALSPPSFATGIDETWRLHLRNDEIRDEPDLAQQPSPAGTEIRFALSLLSQFVPGIQSNVAISTVVDGPTVTPQAELALGDDVGGTLVITAGIDDNPDATLAPDAGFDLGLRLSNPGEVALGDLVQFLQIPAGLRFESASLPAGLGGRVFYSESADFTDPAAPPPVDLSAAIGSADLPEDIDVDGQTLWQALDLDPPTALEAVRWLALYLGELPIDAAAISRVHLRISQPPCSSQSLALPATAQVFSMRPTEGEEVAIAPQPLALADSEPVHLLGAAPALSLSASGEPLLEVGPEGSVLVREFLLGNGGALALQQPTLALDWPRLSINGVAMWPDYVAASGGSIDDANAASGELGVVFDPIAPGEQVAATLSLRYPAGIVDGAMHAVAAEAFAAGGACEDASAIASHSVQLTGSPLLEIAVSADKETLAPGGDLSFTGEHRNGGGAVATAAFVWGEVPADSVFRRADLPPQRRLLCSGPPLDATLPADPADFDAGDFADRFLPGVDTGVGWTCPQGGATSWIALALDDTALTPPAFVPGAPEAWTLHLRNDRIRDEPDEMQEPSPDGTRIVFSPYIGAAGQPAIAAAPAESTVVDILPFTAVCEPPTFTNRDLLDYTVASFNGVAPISVEQIGGTLPGCVNLDAEGRLLGGSNESGEWQASLRLTDAGERSIETTCVFRVLEASVFIDGFELEPATPAPPGGPICP